MLIHKNTKSWREFQSNTKLKIFKIVLIKCSSLAENEIYTSTRFQQWQYVVHVPMHAFRFLFGPRIENIFIFFYYRNVTFILRFSLFYAKIGNISMDIAWKGNIGFESTLAHSKSNSQMCSLLTGFPTLWAINSSDGMSTIFSIWN